MLIWASKQVCYFGSSRDVKSTSSPIQSPKCEWIQVLVGLSHPHTELGLTDIQTLIRINPKILPPICSYSFKRWRWPQWHWETVNGVWKRESEGTGRATERQKGNGQMQGGWEGCLREIEVLSDREDQTRDGFSCNKECFSAAEWTYSFL